MARWSLRLAFVCLVALLVAHPAGARRPPPGALPPSSQAQSPWMILGEVGVDLHDVSFYELHKGWAVGDEGTILNTVDGGPHWMWQDSHTEQPLYGVDMFTRYTGWVVGAGGTVRRTDNGGAHWVHQNPGTDATLTDVDFVDENRGWAVLLESTGGPSGVLHTTDGGTTWSPQPLPPCGDSPCCQYDLWAVAFADRFLGWAGGEMRTGPGCEDRSAVLLRTTDGGRSWAEVDFLDGPLRTGARVEDIIFYQGTYGGLVWNDAEGRGHIACSEDGGASWTPAYADPLGRSLWGISRPDPEHAWAVGQEGLALRTEDACATWEEEETGTGRDLTSVVFLNRYRGWAVGRGGVLLKRYEPPPGTWTFTGHVYEGFRPDASRPLSDVQVTLTGTDDPRVLGYALDVVQTDANGAFTLSTSEAFSYYSLSELDPEGYVSTGVRAGPGGWERAVNWIQYDRPAPGVYTGNAFWDAAATPGTPTASPTPTRTPSATATWTPAPTATATFTSTRTPSPTSTATPRPTASPTPTATETATPSPSPTATPTATPSATLSPTATSTPIPARRFLPLVCRGA